MIRVDYLGSWRRANVSIVQWGLSLNEERDSNGV